MLSHHGVKLESSLGRAVDLFSQRRRTAEDSVANVKALHIGANLNHFAGNVSTKDERVLNITSERGTDELQHPVERVDSHGTVLNDYLARTRGCIG